MLFKNLWGMKFYLGWENAHYLGKRELDFMREPHFMFMEDYKPASVWDVGCSVGFFTLFAARTNPAAFVTSFDLSPRACRFLNHSAAEAGLGIQLRVIPKPLTVQQQFYRRPILCHQANKLTAGPCISADLDWVVKWAGIPQMIKMDIEGGEEEFLLHEPFRAMVFDSNISLFVECHSKEIEELACDFGLTRWLDTNHFYINQARRTK